MNKTRAFDFVAFDVFFKPRNPLHGGVVEVDRTGISTAGHRARPPYRGLQNRCFSEDATFWSQFDGSYTDSNSLFVGHADLFCNRTASHLSVWQSYENTAIDIPPSRMDLTTTLNLFKFYRA